MARLHISRSRPPRWSSALVLVVALAAVGGCATAPPASGGDPDDGTALTFWSRFPEGGVHDLLAQAYNETHENEVEFVSIGNDPQGKVGAAAASGTLPDILAADDIYALSYTDQNLFVDITDRIAGLDFAEELNDAQLNAATLDGRRYAVPSGVGPSMLAVNKDLLEQVGLDPEEVLSSLEAIYEASEVINDELGPEYFGFQFVATHPFWGLPPLYASGEPPLSDDGGTADVETESMLRLIELYKDFYDNGYSPSSVARGEGFETTLFTSGKVAVCIAYANMITADLDETITFDWAYAPIPGIEGGTSSFIGGDVVGITRNSEHVEQAWNFIEWTLSEEAQEVWASVPGSLPNRFDVLDMDVWTGVPHLDEQMEVVRVGVTPSSLAYGEIFNTADGPWKANIETMVFGGGDIDAGLADMQTRMQDALDNVYN